MTQILLVGGPKDGISREIHDTPERAKDCVFGWYYKGQVINGVLHYHYRNPDRTGSPEQPRLKYGDPVISIQNQVVQVEATEDQSMISLAIPPVCRINLQPADAMRLAELLMQATAVKTEKPKLTQVFLFQNSNFVVFDESDQQVGELQASGITDWAEKATRLGYDVEGQIIQVQDYVNFRLFKTSEGNWNFGPVG